MTKCCQCGAIKGQPHKLDCSVPQRSGYNPNCSICWVTPTYGPGHNGSRACRNFRVTGNGAIAAGGTVAHCTCSGCF